MAKSSYKLQAEGFSFFASMSSKYHMYYSASSTFQTPNSPFVFVRNPGVNNENTILLYCTLYAFSFCQRYY